MLCELCGKSHTTGHFYFAQISHRKKAQILHRIWRALCYLRKICAFFLCEICAKPDFGKMSSSVGKSIYLYVVKKLKNYFFRAARIRKNASVAKKSTPRK